MYEYLNDYTFLKRLDLEDRKVQYIRINILDFNTERVLATIEGKATGGSININGSSNVRRTMSCSLIVDQDRIKKQEYKNSFSYTNITEIQNIISMNKKVQAEVGYINTLAWDPSCYPNINIIWFPLGQFIIKSVSVAKSTGGINISMNLNDKTTLLNGDVGGVIPAATVFSEKEIYSADATKRTVQKVLFKDLIKEILTEFGGERLENIIIEDIPNSIRKVVKWVGDKNLYYYEDKKVLDTEDQGEEPTMEFTFGDDCGYVMEPFYYPGTLECKAGDTVATILDKIKNALGNYEWFYDIWGKFHFRQKKNYINNAYSTTIDSITEWEKESENKYLSNMNLSKNVYIFDSSNRKLLTNISSSPQYQNIKNDFIVWGAAKTVSGATKPIRYHLVFDTKPDIQNDSRLCFVYTDYRGLQQVTILQKDINMQVGAPPQDFKDNDKNYYYLVKDNESNKCFVEYWDDENQVFRIFPEWEVCYLKTDDWRTELYFRGIENVNQSFSQNPYAAELNAEWPKIYNVKANNEGTKENKDIGIDIPVYSGAYYENIKPNQYEYFLDFIEGNSKNSVVNLSQYNVNNIGRRTVVGKDNSSTCVFAASIPNLIIVSADGDVSSDYEDALTQEGYEITQVSEDVFNKLSIGGGQISAYEKVKELLIQNTHYNESITLTTIPIYYLEPNTRIHIEDTELGINGDYIINTISLPLTIGTSNISCTKCIENII